MSRQSEERNREKFAEKMRQKSQAVKAAKMVKKPATPAADEGTKK